MKSLLELPYSLFVLVSKHALLAVTAVLCIAVVGTAMFNQRSGGARLVLTGGDAVEATKPVMQKPRYRGIDSKNRPFLIRADTARDEGNKVYRLDNIHASMAAGTTDATELSGDTALYVTAEERIDLRGHVVLESARGYRFETESATLFASTSTAKGDEPIHGQGPAGILKANRFEILDGGQKIVFAGGVRLTLTPKPR